MNKILTSMAILSIALFLLFLARGIIHHTKTNNELIQNCVKTEMYVIGNKGHRSVVYDCSGKRGNNAKDKF